MVGVQILVIMPRFRAEVDQQGEKILSVQKKGGMKAQPPGFIRISVLALVSRALWIME